MVSLFYNSHKLVPIYNNYHNVGLIRDTPG